MDWRLKAVAQAACAALPTRSGDALYHRLQTQRGLAPDPAGHVAFLQRLAAHHDVTGMSVVELGSGWFPLTPLLLLARGADKVHTYDLNRHYSQKRISIAAGALLDCGVEEPILHTVHRTGVLPNGIDYHPNTDLGRARVEHADLALSRFVLEHVEPRAIAAIHQASRQWLQGPWIHWVSSSDHRAFGDPALTNIDFLRYSERRWRLFGGNRFAYHNRLRRPEYRQLFEESGWEPLVDEAVVDETTVAIAASMRLPDRFGYMSCDDLAAGSLWFVLVPIGNSTT